MNRFGGGVFIMAIGAVSVAMAFTVHRSFRNGYPAEWNVSREDAERMRPLSQRSVRFGDGRTGATLGAPEVQYRERAVKGGVPTPPRGVVYVSPAGDDRNDGSAAKPLASVTAARDAVRRIKAKNGGRVPVGGIRVVFEDGVYPFDAPVELTDQDSGVEKSPIVWTARHRGGAKFSGFAKLNWRPLADAEVASRLPAAAKGQVLEAGWPAGAEMPGFMQSGCGYSEEKCHKPFILYQNGERLKVARYPNDCYAETGDPVGDKFFLDCGEKRFNSGRFVFDDPRLAQWRREPDLWANGAWMVEWADATTQITNIDLVAKVVSLDMRPIAFGLKRGASFFVMNAVSELDQPGEWAVDRAKRKIYVWPKAGGELPVAGFTPELFNLQGVKHVDFTGFEMEGSRASVVEGRNCQSVRFLGCRIRRNGGWGVRLNASYRCEVRGCDLEDLGEGGISMHSYLPGKTRYKSERAVACDRLAPDGNVIDNNRIGWFGKVLSNYRPACRVQGVGSRVTHNLIYHTPHSGITHAGNDHYIGFNILHDCCSYNNDAGSIYCCDRDWSKMGTVIEYNLVHMTGKQPRPTHTNAIYLDDWSSGKTVRGNIVCRASLGIYLGGGRENVIERNIALNIPDGVHLGSRGAETKWKFIVNKNRDGEIYRKLLDHPYMYCDPVWTNKYPALVKIASATNGCFEHYALNNVITGNVGVACGNTVFMQNEKVVGPYTVNWDNFTFAEDPGFADYLHLDFNAKPDSPLAKAVGTTRFDEMGLYADKWRFSKPVKFSPDVTMPRPLGTEYDQQIANVSVIIDKLPDGVTAIARDTKNCDVPGWSKGRRVEPHCGEAPFANWKEYVMYFTPNVTAECTLELRGSKHGMTAYDDFRVQGAEIVDPSFEAKGWRKVALGKNPPAAYGSVSAAPGVDKAADGEVFGAASEVYRLESKIKITKDQPVVLRFQFRGIQ